MLYGHFDGLRDRAQDRLAQTLRQTGGTPQARTERDVNAVMYTQRTAQLDAAEKGLCSARIDSHDAEPRYVGRMGIRDEADDYQPLLLDWRAPAAPPFYPAPPRSPARVRRPPVLPGPPRLAGRSPPPSPHQDAAPGGDPPRRRGARPRRRRAGRAGRRPDRGGVAARGAERQPYRPDERHRRDHPGRAGLDHPLPAQGRAG